VAFASARDGRSQPIWVANADGTGLRQVSESLDGRLHGSPAWSPDGRWIAFDAQRDDGHWDIGVIDAAGGPTRLLTSGDSNDNTPSWSRDGRWVYFSSNRTGRQEVWRAPSAGGEPIQVTDQGGNNPTESPDGETLYYARAGVLLARPVAGGPERRIAEQIQGECVPIGTDLYYIAGSGGRGSASTTELRVLDLTSGRTEVLYRLEAPAAKLTVSPDRKTALWRANWSGSTDLMLVEHFR
jgi:Tol biopolymer transport system component